MTVVDSKDFSHKKSNTGLNKLSHNIKDVGIYTMQVNCV